jgi:AcrR family transcriptional regulator
MSTAEKTADRSASKKARTRQRLVDAARTVFNADGFYDSKLSDIPPEAGLSTGTFYNYFTSKEEIFQAVMVDVLAELQEIRTERNIATRRRPVDSIREANRTYLQGYRRNARLMADCNALARMNPAIREIKDQIDSVFETRLATAIRRWQQQGIAINDVDPLYAANALAYMVDRFANEFYVFGKPYEQEQAIDTLTKLWARALGVPTD